jgi:predicted Zn-dependent protease
MKLLFILIILVIIACIVHYNSVFYYYTVPSEIDIHFQRQVREIISKCKWNSMYKLREVHCEELADTIIYLVDRSELDSLHTSGDKYPDGRPIRFSMTLTKPMQVPKIYIDSVNWLKSVPESKLSIEDYRKYVITHELGHALGYDHVPCNKDTAVNGTCPVMYQSTRGCPNGFACGTDVSRNDWSNPFKDDWYSWINWVSNGLNYWFVE